MAIQSCSKLNNCQLNINRLHQTIMTALTSLLNNFQTRHDLVLFFCNIRKTTLPFYRNAFIYINLHPAQNKARIQNLPSERDWKLGSLFRPEIKTNTHERLSLSSATSLAEGTQANVLRLCHCRSTSLYSDSHTPASSGITCLQCKALKLLLRP